MPDADPLELPVDAFRFRPVVWFPETDSTNLRLLARLREADPPPPGTIWAAKKQTTGRGRHGRAWYSEPGQSLTFSFVVQTPEDARLLGSLAQACALAVAELLVEEGARPALKWPNDVLIDGAKLCGVLVETGAAGRAVAGVGLNVNLDRKELAAVPGRATSMRLALDKTYKPETLLERFLLKLQAWINRWLKEGFAGLRDAWTHRAWLAAGDPVTIGIGDDRIEGTLEGYGPFGELLVRQVDDSILPCWSVPDGPNRGA